MLLCVAASEQGFRRLVVTTASAVSTAALRQQAAQEGVELVTAEGQGRQQPVPGAPETRPEFRLVPMLPLLLEQGRAEEEESAAAETLIRLAA